LVERVVLRQIDRNLEAPIFARRVVGIDFNRDGWVARIASEKVMIVRPICSPRPGFASGGGAVCGGERKLRLGCGYVVAPG
jgi:hypothetical protein